jgi:hypothetical protein
MQQRLTTTFAKRCERGTLRAKYAGDPAAHRVDTELMAGFVRFAREAAAGRKAMLLTHSAQVPEGYASTTETADFLIAAVGGAPDPAPLDRDDSWRQSRR